MHVLLTDNRNKLFDYKMKATSEISLGQPDYPQEVASVLKAMKKWDMPFFLTGGAVRDLLLGKMPTDLDITVPADALSVARSFAARIKGVFVLLDEQEEVARVVWRQFYIDFSSFREGTTTIIEDLKLRDFTINAMALPFNFETALFGGIDELLDPLGGLHDIAHNIIKHKHDAVFTKDPLRLMRAFRLRATLGFGISNKTLAVIKDQAHLLTNVSVERIFHELELIILSKKAALCFTEMANHDLLFDLFPEFKKGQGLAQPASHHQDVFNHSLEVLRSIEKILENPDQYFTGHEELISRYLTVPERQGWLKWAALFHDIGKTLTFELRNKRITFYNHDNKGHDLFQVIAQRFRMSKRDMQISAKFIKLHMWPFHLNNALKKTGIKPKACLKLYRAVGEELPGLFILAMADSMAAEGPKKPLGMEEDLLALLTKVTTVLAEKVNPVRSRPPVLTGDDLIKELNLVPGPIFREILTKLEEEQVCNHAMDREEALIWVKSYLAKSHSG